MWLTRAQQRAQVPPPDALKASLANLTATAKQAAAASDASLRKKRDAAAALDARLSDAGAALLRLKEELKAKHEEIVANVMGGGEMDAFLEKLDERQSVVDEKTKSVANLVAYHGVIDQGMSHAEEHGKCMLCDRPFADAREKANFRTKQEDFLVELPAMRAEQEAELKTAADAVAALVRARPLWEECKKLKERDIPKAEDSQKACVPRAAPARFLALTDAAAVAFAGWVSSTPARAPSCRRSRPRRKSSALESGRRWSWQPRRRRWRASALRLPRCCVAPRTSASRWRT